MTVRSVYVHAPFCARRCVYCDFAVHVSRTGDADAWLAALQGELDALEREGWATLGERLETLYVGGGTPSHLGPDAMAGFRRVIGSERLPDEVEWTAEANPESFTPHVADAWRAAGVNRVSLGVQSFSEPVLRWMGRLHGAEGADRAVQTVRDAGFENFSVDLVFGLPEHLERDWSGDLDRVLALEPPHVSLYGLTVESGTALGRAVAEGRETVLGEDAYREQYLEAARRLSDAGYEHYEVSNFARPGRRSRHNAVYWSGAPYLGLGNGAHSYVHPVRRWNHREWEEYRVAAHTGTGVVAESEALTDEAVALERLWLALRTDRGVSRGRLEPSVEAVFDGWLRDGRARLGEDGDRVVLTPRGWLVMDAMTVELEEACDPETLHTLTASADQADFSS